MALSPQRAHTTTAGFLRANAGLLFSAPLSVPSDEWLAGTSPWPRFLSTTNVQRYRVGLLLVVGHPAGWFNAACGTRVRWTQY